MEKLKCVAGKAGVLLLMAVCFLTGKLTVNAEAIEMYYTTEKVEVHEKKSDSSKVLITIEEGIPTMILEKGDDWCQVQYKDAMGYVKTSLLQRENEELAAELDAQQEYNNTFINEIFRLEAEKAKSRIWGAVIVLLIVAIFGVGIFNTIKMNKKEEEKQDDDREDGDDAVAEDGNEKATAVETVSEEMEKEVEAESENTEETEEVKEAEADDEAEEVSEAEEVDEAEEVSEAEEADETEEVSGAEETEETEEVSEAEEADETEEVSEAEEKEETK